MHRTTVRRRALLGALLLALSLGALPAASHAQDKAPPGKTILVPLDGTTTFQMASKKNIKTVDTGPRDNVLSAAPFLNDPTRLRLRGLEAGTTNLTVTDVDDTTERYEVLVQPDIENLKVQLRQAVPTANVQPVPVGNNVVLLNGTVQRTEDVAVVLGVAQALNVPVINALRVGGVQQVQLDVVVAAVTRAELRQLGVDFLVGSRNFQLASLISGLAAPPNPLGNGSNLFGPTINGFGGGTLQVATIHSGWGLLYFIQALRTEQIAKIMAEPRVTTLSGRPASFIVGGEQAIPVPAGLGQVGVQFEEFGIRLNFLPIVLGDGRIHMEVEPEVSNLDAAAGTVIQGTVVPGRATRRVNATVVMEPGHTMVLGGLIRKEITGIATKFPVLGDLPFVGAMFSTKTFQEREEEVLILVTPHLVDAMSCDQAPKYLPGQETRSPDDFELFLEGILEAPRGPRCVCVNGYYVPAFKNSPSYAEFPCGGNCGPKHGGHGGHGGKCGSGCTDGCGAKGPTGCGANGVAPPALAVPPAVPLTPVPPATKAGPPPPPAVLPPAATKASPPAAPKVTPAAAAEKAPKAADKTEKPAKPATLLPVPVAWPLKKDR